jgi:Asp-tRNA(Asn)/Glu-tRNA(Gln) amidotransferase A subunit family amidase
MPVQIMRNRKTSRPFFAGALIALALAAPGIRALQAQSFSVVEKTIPELQAAMQAGTVSSRDLVTLYLDRIKKYDQDGPKLNAMIALNPKALDEAAALDAERRAGRVRGPLHGIPIVVKDNYITQDMPTTAGNKALEGFMAGRDAFMVKKLRDAGAVIVGKTNLHELAYGITTISSAGGQTRNPYDPTRNPGGSSGGTGAAVAANFAAAGMGTDTCGSIRYPSASNNLVGLRGTLGLSSREGIVPLSHTQDIGGPLARTVTDLAIMLDATVGPDPADPLTVIGESHIPASYRAALSADALKGARIGVVTNLFGSAPEDKEAGDVVRAALEVMKQHGADISDIDIDINPMLQGTSVINAEFKYDLNDFLAKFPNAPVHTLQEILDSGKYGPAVEGVLRRSNQVETRESPTSDALIKRIGIKNDIASLIRGERFDALAYPTLRRKPAKIDTAQAGGNCQLSATTGLPAISMQAGFTADGLPIGLELLGNEFTEQRLLNLAYSFEQIAHNRRLPQTTP